MDDIPVFGERLTAVAYVLRPSAYAIIRNEATEVAVVRTSQGVFLPGGGIAAGETPERAVLREVLEECGFSIRLLARLPTAVQLVYSHSELTYFDKPSAFFAAVVDAPHQCEAEPDHEVQWLTPAVAVERLSHESHQWALRGRA